MELYMLSWTFDSLSVPHLEFLVYKNCFHWPADHPIKKEFSK